MRNKENKVPTSIKLQPEIFEKGKVLAKEQSRSFSQYVQYLIKQDIKQKEKIK